jgi:hypothetical protein
MATGISFPSDLPVPDREGYGDQFEESRVSTEMEVGTKRWRMKTRTVPRIFNVQWTLSQDEFHVFDNWWQDSIRGGELEFDIQLSDDMVGLTWYTVRMLTKYSAKYLEDGVPYWNITSKLRAVNDTFGTTRVSASAELRGRIRPTVAVTGKLLVYSQLRGRIYLSTTLRAAFAVGPMIGRCTVGLYRLPRAIFYVPPAIIIPGITVSATVSIIAGSASLSTNATAPGVVFRQTTYNAPPAVTLLPGPATSNTDNSVILLLHADGSNGSTTFVDSGINHNSMTVAGNAQISTTQSEFGGSAITMSGSSSYLRVGTTAGVRPPGFEAIASGTWTIEGWAYIGSTGSYNTMVAEQDTGGTPGSQPYLAIAAVSFSSTIGLDLYTYGTLKAPPRTTRSNNPTLNQWFHWAVVCDAGKIRLFLNGQSTIYRIVGSETFDWIAGGAPAPATIDVFIGHSDTGNFSSAAGSYMDEIRISNKAVYTGSFASFFTVGIDAAPHYAADFTPPSVPFVNPT